MNLKNALVAASHPIALIKKARQILTLSDPAGWEYVTGGGTHSGKVINDDIVFQITAVYRAIKVISGTISTFPVHVYQNQGMGNEIRKEHRYYEKINVAPNKHATAPNFYQSIAVSMSLWNQAYVLVERIGSRIGSMSVVPPYCVQEVPRGLSDIYYRVTINGRQYEYERGEIVPIQGFSKVGSLRGMSVAGLHKNAFALSLAAEEYGSRFFGNGARVGGVLMVDRVLKADQREALRDNFKNLHGGLENSHGLAVLEADMKFQQLTVPNDSAQLLETRRMQVEEVARVFGVPPAKLMLEHGMKYDNLAQMNVGFYQETLHEYINHIEKSFDKDLLTPADRRDGFSIRFDVSNIHRTDRKSQVETVRVAVYSGVITPNEGRDILGYPRLNIKGADSLHIQVNMAPVDMIEEMLTDEKVNGDEDGNKSDTV